MYMFLLISGTLLYNASVQIKTIIRQSPSYQKLLSHINPPPKPERGRICTLSGTTRDVEKIILELLEQETKKAFVFSTLSTRNIRNYFASIEMFTEITFSKLKQLLEEKRFSREDKVTQKKEYTITGDIITFWPSIYNHPVRINFWGEELESIELLDELYNTKIEYLDKFAAGDEGVFEDTAERQHIQLTATNRPIHETCIIFGNGNDTNINFGFTYPPLYFKRLDIFEKDIRQRLQDGWVIEISTRHKSQIPKNYHKNISKEIYNSGFENEELRVAAYTDRELFGTIFIAHEKAKTDKRINRYLAQLEGEIEIGDYIVHEDYGIAVYHGIEQKEVLGKMMDYLILQYAQKDTLSVPLSQVNKLTKYIGPDNVPPKITRLGRAAWKQLKKRVKKSIAFIAKELLQHYAKVEMAKGMNMQTHEWEENFAGEFEFEETNDQKQAISEILNDMQKKTPMNRLLVGDVGFGKTEVAIRAAFRAVMNGYQVAVLCPTTILVSQHYSVFSHRMQNFPIQIATLSRFGTKRENEKTVKKIQLGETDIVIGTHRLLSNDIHFNNLGLIIVDEEQKFGVQQKEKIRKYAYAAHTLSMSATPIPRTLSMALSNLRDISIITTPPPGRKSIKTTVESFSWNKVAKAILREKHRGGQIYFLHNEVRTIESIRNKLEKLLPDVSFRVAHGQMHPQTLNKIMHEFYEQKFDCLVCTTIIENGIDIKNVNTIIINKAERFGLAQLYQLRGRVGRDSKQAYASILYSYRSLKKKDSYDSKGKKVRDPFEKIRARLEAIGEAQSLGAGFKVASRDLEIRGAGNLLGKEQHGNISAIGLGLYTQLLGEEIERVKKLRNG